MPKLNIRRFDPTQMRTNTTAMDIGKRGNGKSTIVKDIMYNLRDKFHFGIHISPTEDSNGQMQGVMPRACIYTSFDDSIVTRSLNFQKKVSRGGGQQRNIFISTDDCMFDPKTLKGKGVREGFMNGRHRNIFLINAVQYMMDIPSGLRGQIDYVFATRDNIISQRDKLWRYFFGMFADFRDFSAVMDQCTEGFNCIVIDNTIRTNNPEECIFWYNANPDLPSFRLCDSVYWNLDKKYFAERDDDDDTDVNIFTVARV